jgi:NAD(P)-dependent dehydrogenase (short-subunit alcohol dehydrogenase family)
VQSVAERLQHGGAEVFAITADLLDPAVVDGFVQAALDRYGAIDLLINNAGAHRQTTPLDPLDSFEEDYEQLVGVNLRAVFLLGRAAGAQMIRQGRGGAIVNIATDHGFTCGAPHDLCPRLPACPWPHRRPLGSTTDIYDASKAATFGLTYVWSQELRPHGIRVNAICMGATDTAMLRGFLGDRLTPEMVASWMTPKASAAVLMDLIDEGPSGRTGQLINLCIGRPPRLEPPTPDLYLSALGAHA